MLATAYMHFGYVWCEAGGRRLLVWNRLSVLVQPKCCLNLGVYLSKLLCAGGTSNTRQQL